MLKLAGRVLWRDRRGSATLEGALMVPVLIAFFAGVFEFSWYFYQQHLVVIGLGGAGSYLAQSIDPCNPASRNWMIEQEYAKNLAATGSILGGKLRLAGWTPKMVQLKCTRISNPIESNGLNRYRAASVDVITVSTHFAYRSVGFLSVLGLRPPAIAAEYSARALGER